MPQVNKYNVMLNDDDITKPAIIEVEAASEFQALRFAMNEAGVTEVSGALVTRTFPAFKVSEKTKSKAASPGWGRRMVRRLSKEAKKK